MRCYRCEKDVPGLFPILMEIVHGKHKVIITAYLCAACTKVAQKELRQGAKN